MEAGEENRMGEKQYLKIKWLKTFQTSGKVKNLRFKKQNEFLIG